eukprot:4664766-Alexandrium_andersonii.AAC.1
MKDVEHQNRDLELNHATPSCAVHTDEASEHIRVAQGRGRVDAKHAALARQSAPLLGRVGVRRFLAESLRRGLEHLDSRTQVLTITSG